MGDANDIALKKKFIIYNSECITPRILRGAMLSVCSKTIVLL